MRQVSMATRDELVVALSDRYARSGRAERSRVLDEFTAVTGFHRKHAMRLLRYKFPQIVDAMDAGGSGDPYAGLNAEEAAALREATRMGFPPKSWFGYKTMGVHAFTAVYQGMVMADPTYFEDFWTKPGYLGFDDPKSFDGARIQFKTSVAAPITALEAAKLKLNTSVVNGTKDGGVDNAFAALQGEGGQRVMAFRLVSTPPPVERVKPSPTCRRMMSIVSAPLFV